MKEGTFYLYPKVRNTGAFPQAPDMRRRGVVKTQPETDNRTVKARASFVVLLLSAVLVLRADTPSFNPPPANKPVTYPAHESHDDEKVSIAIDPYDTPEKAKIFRTNYQEKGFLPIRLIIANDGDEFLMMNDVKIQYITARREKIDPATTDDIYRRVVRLKRNPSSPRVPLPIPRDRSPVTKDAKIAVDELDQAQFVPHPIDPHTLRSGFLFFDISGIDGSKEGAHLSISGLKVGGKELFYFDIPLDKYLTSQPK